MERSPVDLSRLNNAARLAAVATTGLIGTPASPTFDDLAALAARLLRTPLAFVTFVDDTRSYWKSAIGTGIAADDTTARANTVAESFCQYLITTDGPVVITDATQDSLSSDNPSVTSMGVRAWAGFPIRSAEGFVLGSFCVVDTEARTFDDEEIALLGTLAQAAEREVQLRVALDRTTAEAASTALVTSRATRLAAASDRLSDSLNAEQVIAALGSIVVPELGRWLAVGLLGGIASRDLGVAATGNPAQARVVSFIHEDARLQAQFSDAIRMAPLSPDDTRGIGRVIATGRSEYHPSSVQPPDLRLAPHVLDGVWELIAGDAILSVPLMSRGRIIGGLTVGAPGPAREDHLLLEQLALRAATALDNALAYADAQRAVIDLQRSLMPARPPSLPGVDIAARYLPSTSGALVGGDFHQVITDGRDLVMVLGDIEGHGMTSAARMGQLRAAVAALALEGHEPAALLNRLAAHTEQILDIGLATLLIARLKTDTRELLTACAGHPPVVIAQPGSPAYFSPVEPGPPLGVGPANYVQHNQQLPVGTTLVLYSDGLIERRDRHLEVGLEALKTAVDGNVADSTTDGLADAILTALDAETGSVDDIAVLIVRT